MADSEGLSTQGHPGGSNIVSGETSGAAEGGESRGRSTSFDPKIRQVGFQIGDEGATGEGGEWEAAVAVEETSPDDGGISAVSTSDCTMSGDGNNLIIPPAAVSAAKVITSRTVIEAEDPTKSGRTPSPVIVPHLISHGTSKTFDDNSVVENDESLSQLRDVLTLEPMTAGIEGGGGAAASVLAELDMTVDAVGPSDVMGPEGGLMAKRIGDVAVERTAPAMSTGAGKAISEQRGGGGGGAAPINTQEVSPQLASASSTHYAASEEVESPKSATGVTSSYSSIGGEDSMLNMSLGDREPSALLQPMGSLKVSQFLPPSQAVTVGMQPLQPSGSGDHLNPSPMISLTLTPSAAKAAAKSPSPTHPTALAEGQSTSEKASLVEKKEKKKKIKKDIEVPPPKPKLSKAERRALQEKQRAAKAATKKGDAATAGAPSTTSGVASTHVSSSQKGAEAGGGASAGVGTSDSKAGGDLNRRQSTAMKPAATMQFDDKKAVARLAKRAVVPRGASQMEFFRHLPDYEGSALDDYFRAAGLNYDATLPTVIQTLGLQYARGTLTGGSNRAVAMLNAFKEVITNYKTPEGKVLVRDFMTHIGKMIQFINDCRPMSASMGNAVKWFKAVISDMSHRLSLGYQQSDEDAKTELLEHINRYIQEKLYFAGEIIARNAASKINDHDCILLYSACNVVVHAIEVALKEGRKFHVVVVESRPKEEGLKALRRLLQKGIRCTFVTINGLSNIMEEVNKVLMSASSVFTNGNVLARSGAAIVAMMARKANKPVMFLCESCKFHERVQCDSFTYNELGGAHEVVKVKGRASKLSGWEKNENLSILNLVYDVTPSEFVTLIVTEYGLVPPTSVPVILRESRKEAGV